MDAQSRAERLDRVRRLADWLESHPECPLPTEWMERRFRAYEVDDLETAVRIARSVPRVEKRLEDTLFYLTVEPEDGTMLEYVIWRSRVCRPKVVGTRHVEEQVIKAHDEEVVEWECEPLLGQLEPLGVALKEVKDGV